MFWFLVMTVATPHSGNEYIIDRFRTMGDCYAASQKTHNTHYHGTHVTFACELTRTEKK